MNQELDLAVETPHDLLVALWQWKHVRRLLDEQEARKKEAEAEYVEQCTAYDDLWKAEELRRKEFLAQFEDWRQELIISG